MIALRILREELNPQFPTRLPPLVTPVEGRAVLSGTLSNSVGLYGAFLFEPVQTARTPPAARNRRWTFAEGN